MNEPNSKETIDLKIKSFFRYDKWAWAVGLIADFIAIIGIIQVQTPSSGGISFKNFVTPGLALFVWFIAAYTYVAYLHRYWEKNRAEKAFADGFGLFLLFDLIAGFRRPPLLLPLLVSIITLLWISHKVSDDLSAILGVAGIIGVFLAYAIISADYSGYRYKSYAKRLVTERWDDLKTVIDRKLTEKGKISHKDFEDIRDGWGIEGNALRVALDNHAFARYAIEFHQEVSYSKEGNRRLLIRKRIVVNSTDSVES